MGVKGLSYYMKQIPQGREQINILDEIEQFQLESGKPQATIVFDVMGFIHSFSQTNDECVLGGRHNVYLQMATNFFEEMTNRGAKLAFFCDGQLQQDRINTWCSRKNREYVRTSSLLSEIDSGRYHCSDKYSHNGTKYFVNSLLETAKLYGDVTITMDYDCDAITAQYATQNDALAIVASDSDYLIYEGNWQHWEVATLDMKQFTVKRFNRNALIEDLALTRDQMKAFATIVGNDHTEIMKLGTNIRASAKFCRTLISMQDHSTHRQIADFISNGRVRHSDAIKIIKNSIESYNINFKLTSEVDNLELYARENVLMHAILNDGIFQYHVNYVDFGRASNNNNENFMDRILNAMRRLGGVLLEGRKTQRNSFKMMTKQSLEATYELSHEIVEYPKVDMPTLKDLIFGESDLDDTRWKLAMWCLNFKEEFYNGLKTIPKDLIIVVTAIAFLCNAREISMLHADALLLTEYTSSRPDADHKVLEPRTMCGDIVRAAHAYNRTMLLIWDCFTICGLQRFISKSYFDGYLFHNLCLEFGQLAQNYDHEMTTVKDWRLYAKPNLYSNE